MDYGPNLMKTEKIVVVGGGSSGWMSAAFLKKTFPEREIVVIESPDVPTVGVGESTLGDMALFRDYLGIDEKDFLQFTDGSYKLSIKFTDFYKKDSGSFHYPFGRPHLQDEIAPEVWMTLKALDPSLPTEDFVRSFFPQAYLFEQNKYDPNRYSQFDPFDSRRDVAYHFDATKFGVWLKDRYCIPRGVRYIQDTVEGCVTGEEGIEFLLLKKTGKLSADLFVDCTGFRSLLLSHYLKEPFTSYAEMLPNNRAWAVQVPYVDRQKELEPFTNCTAIANGWCWNIPLWSRLGTGYVYSDKFISPEDAAEEYKQYLMSDKMVIPRTKEQVEQLKFKDVEMRVGIHERTFVKNVVAIGLSAGFIEPLESNGLFTVQRFLVRLAKTLLRGEVSQWDRDAYNTSTQQIYKTFAEFVAMHYALSHRDDSEYWKSVQRKTYSPGMSSLEFSPVIGFLDLQSRKLSQHSIDYQSGITYISIGMNYPMSDIVDVRWFSQDRYDRSQIEQVKRILTRRKARWEDAARTSLSLHDYLEKHIFNTSS